MQKNQANAKQHSVAELLALENYSHSSSTLPTKNNRTYYKKLAKEHVYLYSWDYAINHNENEDENEKGLDMKTNININSNVNQYNDVYKY